LDQGHMLPVPFLHEFPRLIDTLRQLAHPDVRTGKEAGGAKA
jgi:hypothetical protein